MKKYETTDLVQATRTFCDVAPGELLAVEGGILAEIRAGIDNLYTLQDGIVATAKEAETRLGCWLFC
jgi:hypothetical protein